MNNKIMRIIEKQSELKGLMQDLKNEVIRKVPDYSYGNGHKNVIGQIVYDDLIIAHIQALECLDGECEYIDSYYVKTKQGELYSLDLDLIASEASKAYDESTTEVVYSNGYINNITSELASIARKINTILKSEY